MKKISLERLDKVYEEFYKEDEEFQEELLEEAGESDRDERYIKLSADINILRGYRYRLFNLCLDEV
mgnify:FL=1